MVDIYTAYRILNKSILDVADSVIILDTIEADEKPYQIRLEETTFSIAERRTRLEGSVLVAHDVRQYVNKFYSITLDTNKTVLLDYLINIRPEHINLTEFGEVLWYSEQLQ